MQCGKSSPTFINLIQYSKSPNNKIGGPFLLDWSCFPNRDKISSNVKSKIEYIVDRICKKTRLPFVGIEFFIKKEDIFINEITWRPEDAGFVTLLSHEPNQFSAFIQSYQEKKL